MAVTRPDAKGTAMIGTAATSGAMVFVNFARRDEDCVRGMVAHLKAAGENAWAGIDVPGGEEWERHIQRTIESAAAVIVVMSPSAEKSGWAASELRKARQLNKPLFPVLLAGHVFFALRNVPHEDVRGGRMPGASFVQRLKVAAPPPKPGPGGFFARVSSMAAREFSLTVQDGSVEPPVDIVTGSWRGGVEHDTMLMNRTPIPEPPEDAFGVREWKFKFFSGGKSRACRVVVKATGAYNRRLNSVELWLDGALLEKQTGP